MTRRIVLVRFIILLYQDNNIVGVVFQENHIEGFDLWTLMNIMI